VTAEASTHHARVSWDAREARPDLRAHKVEVADQAIAGSCSSALGGDPSRADSRAHRACFIANSVACPVEVAWRPYKAEAR
jgi:organic hydroperoxide reductase OsmC/OhrA